MLQFLEHRFNLEHDVTIGVEFGSRMINVGGKDIKLQLWDTAGQEEYKSITRSYYRGCIGIVLVYDITRRKSFENLSKWIEDTRKYANDKVSIMLLGNKDDLAEKRVVSEEEGREFALKHNLLFFETSAKTAHNVDFSFEKLTEMLIERINKGELNESDESLGVKRGLIEKKLLVNKPEPTKFWCSLI